MGRTQRDCESGHPDVDNKELENQGAYGVLYYSVLSSMGPCLKKKKCLTTISATSHLGVVRRETEEQKQSNGRAAASALAVPGARNLKNQTSVKWTFCDVH